jgi:hypothetical protein
VASESEMNDTLLGETLKSMGVDDEEIKEVIITQKADRNAEDDSHKMPDVQPANLAIVELFLTVAKYWERAGMEAIQLYLDPLKVEARASKLVWYKTLDDHMKELLWFGLDMMENTCLTTWAEHKKRND